MQDTTEQEKQLANCILRALKPERDAVA